MKPIAVQLYTLREAAAKDLPGVLRSVADIGYVGVEFAGLHGHDPKEIALLLDNLGLRVCASHIQLPTSENINQIVEAELELGNNWVITSFNYSDFPTADAARAAAEKLNLAAELLRPHGMNLGYHNHWWEFETADGERIYDILLECVPDMASELDVYWTALAGADPAEVIRQYSSRIPLLHIKDGPLVQGAPHTPVGMGKLDIPGIINAADNDTLQWLIVELDECATNMLDAVRHSYEFLVGNELARGRN